MEGQIYHRNFIHRSNCLFVIIFGSWLLGLLSLVSAVPAAGQTITPDGTAGTAINLNGTTFSITGGTIAASNLLHSFDKFGLDTGFVADFQGPGGGAIANIIGRVTGGELSSIDGTLRAFTNLYLISPAGMKKQVPNSRSASCMKPAAVSTGRANACRMAVMNIPQIVIGIRNNVMPGARMLMIVVR